ncbi:MAG: hypothetical protein AB3N33_11855 [Puniceicoccaceae bacterium]
MTTTIDSDVADDSAAKILDRSSLYRQFLAEREEILKLKWIESEKAGQDIGFEKALLMWVRQHRSHWRARNRVAR